MKTFSAVVLSMIIAKAISGQSLYVKTFGENGRNPIIFLHDGPGHNSASFEGTTAQKLADQGNFVIIYDRRGEGRSNDYYAESTFQMAFDDLNTIYEKYDLEKATLIGHGFGGMVGILFTEKYAEKVNQLFLVSVPVNLQESFGLLKISAKRALLEPSKRNEIGHVILYFDMDSTSFEYSSFWLAHARTTGAIDAKHLSSESIALRKELGRSALSEFSKSWNASPAKEFIESEHYTSLDLMQNIKNIVNYKVEVKAIYGKEDGLHSEELIEKLKKIIGTENMHYLDNCSHDVFIDQQAEFLKRIRK